MKPIVLTAEQVHLVLQAKGPLEVLDEQGRTVAHLTPLNPADVEDIERAKRNRAKGGKPIPAARVQAFLQKLHEIESEGITQAKIEDLLQRTQAGEPL